MRRSALLAPAAFLLLLSGCPDGGGAGGGQAVFVGGDGVFSPGFVSLAEGAAEGAYIITPYVNDTSVPAIKAFSEAFAAEYKTEPDAWAALAYDAVGTMARAIDVAIEKTGKPDSAAITEALAAMSTPEKGYNGVTGITYFDENGDCKKPAIVSLVSGGRLTKAPLQLAEGKPPSTSGALASGKAAEGEPILIGMAGPFTGPDQDLGLMSQKGAKLKVAELNASGGVRGRRIELVLGDDEGKNSNAKTVADGFAARKLVAVIGHFNSTCTLAAKPVYKDAGIPAISPGSTNVEVCQGSKYMFRNLYRDDFQGFTIAEFIKNKLQKTRVVVFYDNDDYGAGLKKFFVQRATELGLEVKKEIPYNRGSLTDVTPLVTSAKYERPEVVFVAGTYQAAALIVKACKKAGVTP